MGKKWKAPKIYTMEQGTPEWFGIKAGKLSGSSAKVMKALGYGKGLQSLVKRKVEEIVYGIDADALSSSVIGADTEHGHKYEDYARQDLEDIMGVPVRQVGWVEASDYVGCSPDGLMIFDDTEFVVEIKCFQEKHHMECVKLADSAYEVESDINLQVQWNMMVTGAKKATVCFFYPAGTPFVEDKDRKRHVVVERDENLISVLRTKAEMCEDLIAIGVEAEKAKMAEQEAKDSTKYDMF
jgi:hypothetical protein